MDAPDETSHMVVHSVIHTYAAAICYTNFVQSKLNTWPCPCAMCFHLSTRCANVHPPEYMVCIHLSQVLENTELAYYVTVNHSVADGHFDRTIHLCRSNK